jgi:hypothetical protein
VEYEDKRTDLKKRIIEKYNEWPVDMQNLIRKDFFCDFNNFIYSVNNIN